MDLKQYRAKLIGSDDERAVSPVIGVILMVAITVILAAVIAAFVLDMGQGQSQSAAAGVQFDQEGDQIDVTINSIDRADEIRVESVDCDVGGGDSTTLNSVGQTATVDCSSYSGSTSIQVIGVYDGSENVLNTYEYDDS